MSRESLQTDEEKSMENMELPPELPVTPASNKSCVKMWMEKQSQGILSCTHFKEHWRIWVPKIYSPEANGNCLNPCFDEDKAQEMLYNPLEEFICNGNPQVILQQLSKMDRPPSMCGRVFKMGEPTYSCRECGMDGTCVLCVDCFKQSAHRNHKYKMGTSCGGGCCDCGDPEAWKNEPFCKTHLAGIQSKESSGNKLPGDVAERAVATFEAVLKYCYELITLQHTPGLPSDLCVKESDESPLSLLATTDTYCTVVYNDETHTFEQVINTLTRVMKCTQREAIEYVTNIDREGRAIVKCSGFQHCSELKSDIEKFTSRHSNRLIKVLVVHAHVLAHQTFAMKLLNWLEKFISHCEGFRVLFSNVALYTKMPDLSIVEGILMRDSQLWKAARTAWHRLFIAGMLLEYESKKALATVFTYNYGSVMKDFIRDDHDHSFSIISLSIQLYTVPTLTHHLIAHHDVLFILLNTFISESSRRCNAAGKLEFERSTPNTTFKRAQYILSDLKYLLSAKPEVWTDELRRGFLQGMSLLLTLLCSMQSMDAVVRQIRQHMEYEPDWESAFYLHIKLSPVITLALEWCGSDRTVFIKAFRLVLRKLYEQQGNEGTPGVLRELADHSATCIEYDVSSEPVSIHLPLSRFLAGLFLYLEKFKLDVQSPEFINQTKPSPEQIIEPVLQAQAMISQVHSGMWKRNGYSLMHQLFFYHNVKCRSEMLDRDIVLLQVGASLIESNEFLIHILNKYDLLNWAYPEFEASSLTIPEEDIMRQTINLVGEFLGLLITIIGERYVPGVGQVTADDRLKKDVIQELCIKPLSHSELVKSLSDDFHFENGMERVIKDVADFKKPTGTSAAKGVYELKPEFYSEYNVFFYHYTKEELSKSEEAQRKRRKAAGELECCPPPKLPKLALPFTLIVNLLQCDVMLHIEHVVLERALNLAAKSFSEVHIHKVLHLIGYALQEEESGNYPFLLFTERATKWGIYRLLELLDAAPTSRIEAHKDLLKWVLIKYRQVTGMATTSSSAKSAAQEQTGDTETSKTDKEWRTQLAAQKRCKIMAQMQAMQKNFMKKYAKVFEEENIQGSKGSDRSSVMDVAECGDEPPVALGNAQTSGLLEEKTYTCILCQEDQTVTASGPAMVLAAFVQQSTVLCQNRTAIEEPDPLYLSANLGASPHTSTCSHVMHARCWQNYFDNVLAKENRRPYRSRQPASFDVEKHEYLCPLCECLSNTVLPLLPPLGSLQPRTQDKQDLSFENWLEVLQLTLNYKAKTKQSGKEQGTSKEIHDASCRYYSDAKSSSSSCVEAENCSEHNEATYPTHAIGRKLDDAGQVFESAYSQPGPGLSENLIAMIHLFAQAAYTEGLNAEPHEGDSRVPLLTWKSTAYTIHAIEFLLRDMEKPLLGALSSRQRDSLEGLTRISAILGSTWTNSSHTSPTWADKVIIGNHALSILSMLLRNPHEGPSVLQWDPFGVLIPLINCLPSLFNTKGSLPPPVITGGVHEFHALKLVFLSLIVKILLTTDFKTSEVMDVDAGESVDKTDCSSILNLMEILSLNIGEQTVSELWRRVKEACLPFLRCCALYFHYVTDIPAPAELADKDGGTYENICKYLGLPETCNELLGSFPETVKQLIVLWKSHPNVQAHLSGAGTVTIVKEPLRVTELIDLPEDYSELMNTISSFNCPNSEGETSRNPVLCLVCGEVLCSQSYCCQFELNKIMVGSSVYHANECGSGLGIFLRVRECDIVVLKDPYRGSICCSPYLDEYGETDQGLRRGNPLKLCRDKYREFNRLWLGHGLHESVARFIELSGHLVTTQWHTL